MENSKLTPEKKTSEEKNTSVFGFNKATWIFVIAAFILAVIPFIFPVSHGKRYYYLLDYSKHSQKYILYVFPLFGLVAGCLYKKILRIIICVAISIYALVPCFYVSGDENVVPSWGAIFLVGGIATFLWLASMEQSKLEEIPSPLRDIEAQKKWIYVLLAVIGSLFFYICDVTGYARGGVSASHWMYIAMKLGGSDGWFMIVQPIIAAAAVICGLKGIKALNIVMGYLMFITPIFLLADSDSEMRMKIGFYLYILCSTGMVLIAFNQKSSSENKEQRQDI